MGSAITLEQALMSLIGPDMHARCRARRENISWGIFVHDYSFNYGNLRDIALRDTTTTTNQNNNDSRCMLLSSQAF